MSNRPGRKASHSVDKTEHGRTSSAEHGHRFDSRWIGVGLTGAVVIALLVAVLVTRGGSPGEPALDALAAKGHDIAQANGCLSCHSTSGNRSEGPTWKGLYSSTVSLTDGSSVTADDAYLRRSIQEPRSQIVTGFRSSMPTNKLSTDDIAAIVSYIKSLR